MLDLLFPRCCFACQKEGDYLCVPCKKELVPHPEVCPICHRISPGRLVCLNCKKHTKEIEGSIVCFQHTGVLKKLIRKLKYAHARSLAPFLIERAHYILSTHTTLSSAINNETVAITHVPSHRRKTHMVRGYNQSQLLAQALAQRLYIPHLACCKKILRTKSQATLSRKKRRQNLRHAFMPIKTDVCDKKHIIIVDDITTTGSTLLSVAACIKKQWPTCTIRGFVLGRHGR